MSSVIRKADEGSTATWVLAADPRRTKKQALIAAAGAITLLLADKILPLLWHLFILGLEVMEALMDHMLESVFGLDAWTAQLVTAWTGFFIGLKIAFVLVRKLREVYRRVTARVLAWYDSHHLHL